MLEIVLMTNGVRTTVHGTQTTAKLSEEVNTSSKFEFTINYGDESFDNVFPKITRVIAYDTLPNQVVFEGYVYSSIPKASSEGVKKQVSAVHISSMLCDACVVGFEDDSGNLSTMVSRLLGIYNATARNEDRIEMGSAPVSGGHPEVVHIASATCWDALTQLVVTEAGYSFRTRYANGSWYLDIADDFGEIATEDLIYGVNLTEISQELNASELYTRIIPIGGASYIPDDKINPTMSSIHGTEGMPLTLYKYFGNSEPEASRIYIANEDLEKKYPVTAKIVQYDNIVATDDTDFTTAQGNLYSKAAYDAARLTDIIESYKANAIDLARAGYDYDTIELNKMYRVINNKIGIDTYLQVTSKKTDYSNPAKSDLTFGGVGAKASKWMSRKGKTTDQKISSVASGSYKTTNTRMGGMSMRNQSKSEYESASSHDANTLYTVSDAGTGKVELYLGDTKISGEEGGGVEVQTAVLYDAANLHEYTVTNELMVDISANTKLYYGGTGKMIVAQGMLCYFGSRTLSGSDFTDALDTLLTQNSEYISPEYTGITSYYVNPSHVVFRHEVDIRVYPYEIDVAQTNNQVRWWFRIEATITRTNMSTSAVTVSTSTEEVNFNTADITDITDYGLILVSQYAGASSPDSYLNSYIPNGYIGSNSSSPSTNAVSAMLVYKNGNQAVNKWNANYAGTIGSSSTYTLLGAASYMPLSAGETVFAMGATQRSEPVSGGGT